MSYGIQALVLIAIFAVAAVLLLAADRRDVPLTVGLVLACIYFAGSEAALWAMNT